MSDGLSCYPVILTKLDQVLIVVVGGGRVSERKVAGLLDADAKVRVISPQLTETLQRWEGEGRIQWVERPYQPGDLNDAWMTIASTNQVEVNARVAHDARQRGILCNVADAPQEGNFHVPAVYRGANEMVTVSTYGNSPARAGELRTRIVEWLKESEAGR